MSATRKTAPTTGTPRVRFNCVCCCEDHTSVPVIIQDDLLCVECFKGGIVTQFEDALSDETQYPVTWGGHELNIENYRHHITSDLLSRWNAKLPEYQTGIQDRLYCNGAGRSLQDAASMAISRSGLESTQRCGTFLGSKKALRNTILPPYVMIIANLPPTTKIRDLEASISQFFGRITECRQLRADPAFAAEVTFVNEIAAQQFLVLCDGSSNLDGSILRVHAESKDIAQLKGRIVECTSCLVEVCTKCSEVISRHRTHKCELDADEDPFRGLIRGKDYQVCPNPSCHIKIALRDGCNHIKCRFCRTDFCYVCGTEATHSSSHWRVGSPCPRYGSPGSRGATHDADTAVRRYQAAEQRAAADRRAQRARDELQRTEDDLRIQRQYALREAEREAEDRRQEDAPIAHTFEYQRMVKDQNDLKTFRIFARHLQPTDPWRSFLDILLRELEVHVSHLRPPNGRPLYHLRPDAIAANRIIRETIVLIGLEKLIPIAMGIISRYSDAWHGDQNLKSVASSSLGRIRHRHQLIIQQVLHLLPLDLAHPWLLRVRELCALLDLGTERYVRQYRVLSESQQLADTLHRLAHPRYVELLATLQDDASIRQNERAKQASALLIPVIEAYGLAVLGDTAELQTRFRGPLDPPVA